MEDWGVKIYLNGQWVSLSDIIERATKFDAVKSWWLVFNQTIDSADARERLAEVLEIK